MKTSRTSALCIALPLVIACASGARAPTARVPPELEHVAGVHRSRCGSCHTRVEPGERSREALDTALARHRKRLHLTEDEWAQMIEYLAARESTGAAGDSVDKVTGRRAVR